MSILSCWNVCCGRNKLLRANCGDAMYWSRWMLLDIRRCVAWPGNCDTRKLVWLTCRVAHLAIYWQIAHSRTWRGHVCNLERFGHAAVRNERLVWPKAQEAMFWKYKCLTMRITWILVRLLWYKNITRRNVLYFG